MAGAALAISPRELTNCGEVLSPESPCFGILMANQSQTGIEPSRFNSVLAREPFKGLKAILDNVCSDHEALCAGVDSANSYEELLTKLGYRLTLTNQIHVNDCYARVGPRGGIKAVLPYYDIPTQSSFPTLVNFDGSVTATPKSAGFFNQMLGALKTQLSAEG